MAGEALGDAASASSFLCSADELRFDAPARALAAEEALQPVWLYFASSASTRPPVRWRPRRRCSPCGSTSRAPLRRARPCAGGRGGAAARVALLRAAHVHAPPAALRAGDGRPRRQGQLRARRRQR
ncbi:uncharacterized protein [Triticum aestivum]|uniref:uncharacterized protein n=1 Tax=Triticum aestivum TaxID=4565 RepID=UPI001D033376|nr:uncharacterized protein LOC123064200 [Triticum aestivum]